MAEMPRLLESCVIAEGVIKAIRNQAKVALENDQPIAGWELKPGHTRSKITDTEEVYRRAAILGIDGVAFSKKVTITRKDLEGLCRDELELKGAKLNDTVFNLMEECTTDSVTAPSLREAKK